MIRVKEREQLLKALLGFQKGGDDSLELTPNTLRVITAADPHHNLRIICSIVNLTILSRAALIEPNPCPSWDGKGMSRLSNQHSWHQSPKQKPNMTPSRLDVTKDVEMTSAGDRWMLEILVPTFVSV